MSYGSTSLFWMIYSFRVGIILNYWVVDVFVISAVNPFPELCDLKVSQIYVYFKCFNLIHMYTLWMVGNISLCALNVMANVL